MAVENLITEHIDIWTSAVKTRSTSGRGSSKKLELYGVKKLRELILELAVRGQLVPQDPNDEPASVLLESIAEEKEQLVKEKKIRKEKNLPDISDVEKPFLLPIGWSWSFLGSVCQIERGGSPRPIKSFLTDSPNGLNWIKIGDTQIGGKYITHAAEKIRPEGLSKTRKVFPGDFLLTNSMSFGRPYITQIEGCIHDGWLRISPPVSLNKDYLYNLLSSPFIVSSFKDSAAGAVVMNLNADKVRETIIAIPPTSEQHRIVAKVDELMALCDQLEQQTETSIEAHQVLVTTLLDTLTNSADADELMKNWARISEHFDTLFTTEESIDQLKQTILQLAVMGKLVPQDPSDEPAAKLLKRIAEEKAQLVKEKKIKKQKVLPPISEDEKPFELPNGWEWCRIQDVALFTTSGSRDWAKYYSDSGALFVTMGNLSRGSYELRLDNLRFVRPPKGSEGSRTKLEARDLLISITGDVGNLGLIPEEFGEAYINQHTCLLRFMPECQGKYFPDFMRSPLAKYQFDAPQRGIKNSFRLSDVGEMHLPLPPLNEQVRITEKVSDLLSICERLKVRLRESQITQLHLTDVIAEQAV
ncbi:MULTISPECIES: restriction endonuclease subunit S [Vibrio]|uniref:restriction endonuclease subunit S n=1 Tax=Vibrio TaxID=662 RepID=UPI00124F667B|nr:MULTISPECIES: restriction endonuclease subunit S [Vibrio]EJL6719486.1 restriction endonuclease subunit S [Vibrio alginolyticus]KAB2113794.1 restriction endonuclease subunit S [Vibrio alginolyticus]MBY7696616.1 restriction endonuclease subunit S [Vibrio alginolyticus]MDA0406366.1 restriction endonuclease subunit S [Vibrio alginolyticus]